MMSSCCTFRLKRRRALSWTHLRKVEFLPSFSPKPCSTDARVCPSYSGQGKLAGFHESGSGLSAFRTGSEIFLDRERGPVVIAIDIVSLLQRDSAGANILRWKTIDFERLKPAVQQPDEGFEHPSAPRRWLDEDERNQDEDDHGDAFVDVLHA